MLNAFHDGKSAKIFKTIVFVFISMGALGLVFMDINGVFRGGVSNTTVAKVGRTKISQSDFERVASDAVRQQNMSMQEAYRFGMLNNILDEMIQRDILRQWTQRQGLIVGRDQVAATVHDLIKAQVQPGETPQDALTRMLRTQGVTESELTQSVRAAKSSELIQRPLMGSVSYVPRLATEALARFHAERRDIMFFTLTPQSVGGDIKADDATLTTYYEGIKDQYQIPEQRNFRVMVLDLNDAKNNVHITDEDVAKAYAERADQFRVGEQRTIEQAVLHDEAAAKKLSEDVRAGKSLKALAGNDYRPATDVTKEGLPSELSEPVFSAEKGTVLNPIQTPLGWHVIRLADVKPARTLELAAVRADLRKELESDALHDDMEGRISKVDEALSNGDSIDQIAESMGLAVKTIGPIDAKGEFKPEGADPVLGTLAQNKDLLNTLFELMEGETADLVEVSDGVYAIFSLENVTPTRDRDFSEVKGDVEKRWLDEQRQTALNSVVETLIQKLDKGEADFAKAAAEQHAVLKTARDVSRESKVAGLNDPVALGRLFDETDLDNVVRVNTEGGVILAKVLDARIPEAGRGNPTPEAEKQWRMQMSQAVMNLYFDDLRTLYHVKVNDELLNRMYGENTDTAQP